MCKFGVVGYPRGFAGLPRCRPPRPITWAVDPLRSFSKLADRHSVGDRHYRVAEAVREGWGVDFPSFPCYVCGSFGFLGFDI